MIKPPKFIETKDKKTLEIESYANGKFKIKSEGSFLMYDISKGTFFNLVNGNEVAVDLLPRDVEPHKFWMRRHEKVMADIELMTANRKLKRSRKWNKVR